LSYIAPPTRVLRTVHIPPTPPPRDDIAPIIAMQIRATIRPYSIAVAPR
jgi:hypothetical protein